MNARQKNLVTLLATTLVAGGLGLYAYLGVMEPEQKETQRKEVEAMLFPAHSPGEHGTDGGAPPAPVFTWLSVEVHPAKTVMELQNGAWRITSPLSSRADKDKVEGFTRELASAKFKSTLEENPTDADLERYGLKPPRATVTVRAYVPDAQGGGADDPQRQRTLTFSIGIENTFDGSFYVRREGDPRVYIAHGSLHYVMSKHTDEWRDRLMFPVDEPSLLRIEVKAQKNAFTLERPSTDQPWQLTQPVALRADGERVARMVSALKDSRALVFPSKEREEKVRMALEKPLVEARFVPKLGEPVRVRLTELEFDKLKQVFALSEWGSESVLAQVDNTALSLLDVATPEFKDKKALAFTVNDVHQLVIHPAPGGELIKLAKTQDTEKWEVVAPMPGRAKEFKVASLLGSLEKLKAAALGETRPKSWSRYGIGDTSRGVSLLGSDGKELARLWLGSEVKGNPQRLWARGSSEDVLELEKSALDALPLTLADLLEGAPAASSSP